NLDGAKRSLLHRVRPWLQFTYVSLHINPLDRVEIKAKGIHVPRILANISKLFPTTRATKKHP
ncbi:hypothetical protein KA005_00470, partial [bacterium]|nr:hypothetical protein [bacterium]